MGLAEHRFGNMQAALDFGIEMSCLKSFFYYYREERWAGVAAVLTILTCSEGR